MKISGSTALVTGANRGLGRAFVGALRAAGCAKIYAAARCADIDLLINNAGVARFGPALAAPTMDDARLEAETHYFGTLAMCRAFAPVLKRNGGGALVNMLSAVSFFNAPMQGTYCASKAAARSLTKDVHFELRAQGTLVVGVYAGYIDTDMTANLDNTPKSSPAAIAARVLARHRSRRARHRGLLNHRDGFNDAANLRRKHSSVPNGDLISACCTVLCRRIVGNHQFRRVNAGRAQHQAVSATKSRSSSRAGCRSDRRAAAAQADNHVVKLKAKGSRDGELAHTIGIAQGAGRAAVAGREETDRLESRYRARASGHTPRSQSLFPTTF